MIINQIVISEEDKDEKLYLIKSKIKSELEYLDYCEKENTKTKEEIMASRILCLELKGIIEGSKL